VDKSDEKQHRINRKRIEFGVWVYKDERDMLRGRKPRRTKFHITF
jgi:hypothetical protein